MNSSPLVSIIVPVYKVEKYLAECLDSICAQTYKHIEIIAVDDASPDGCAQILADYAARDKRMRVITHTENTGNSVARNTGMDASEGAYILFVDSDDYVDTQLVEKAIARAMKYDTDIVMWGIWTFYEDKKHTDYACHCEWKGIKAEAPFSVHTHPQLYHDIFLYPFHNPVNKLFKKSFLIAHKIRFIPKILYEDMPFADMTLLRASAMVYINECLYFYRRRSDMNNPSIMDKANILANLHTLQCMRQQFIDENLYERVHPAFMYFCYRSFFSDLYLYLFSQDIHEFYRRLRAWTQEIYPSPQSKKAFSQASKYFTEIEKLDVANIFTCETLTAYLSAQRMRYQNVDAEFLLLMIQNKAQDYYQHSATQKSLFLQRFLFLIRFIFMDECAHSRPRLLRYLHYVLRPFTLFRFYFFHK